MSDDQQEEEWLYGGENAPKAEPGLAGQEDGENESKDEPMEDNGEHFGEEGEAPDAAVVADGPAVVKEGAEENDEGAEDGEDDDEDEDEDSDDDDDGVQVVIGDIKSSTVTAQASFASKRPAGPPPDKKGKFSTDDFEGVGTINGVPAQDFSLDSIEEKPWRKPGADLTDYFNYGFTEETWRAYCDRQKRLRYESGNTMPIIERERKHHPQGGSHPTTIPIVGSDNSKYGGPPNVVFPKKFGMQDRMPKDIQRITRGRDEHRENTIQVMTADRREYSRKAFDMPPPPIPPPPFDLSVPPPSFPPPDPYGGPPDFFNHPPPPRYYPEEHLDYEEQQWMDSAWEANMKGPGPSGITTVVPLTKVPHLPPPPGEGDDLDPPAKDKKS